MFDMCTTGDTAHIDTIFKFLPHTRQHGSIDILVHTLASPSGRNLNYDKNNKKNSSFFFYLYSFRKYVSYGLPTINFW
jgi:hypothetical protein